MYKFVRTCTNPIVGEKMNLVNSRLSIIEEETANASVKKDLEKPDLTAAEFKKLLDQERIKNEKDTRLK